MSKKYLLWYGVMFPYGFYRQWNSKIPEGFDLYGHRLAASTFNGFVYMSPFGVLKIFNFINRFDIDYNNRDKTKYLTHMKN